ncbi:MAG: hypothetical protein LC797_17635 [Chloroflexi bacterium]|nr:hypothetical protein [Chloroflexota bacterium]
MDDESLKLALQLDAGSDSDAQELDQLTSGLRRQLLELDVQSVDRVQTGAAPAGTRAVEMLALGGLLVTLAKSPGMLKAVVGVIQSAVSAHAGRSVEIVVGGETLKLSSVSSDEQRRLIDLFVTRHAG